MWRLVYRRVVMYSIQFYPNVVPSARGILTILTRSVRGRPCSSFCQDGVAAADRGGGDDACHTRSHIQNRQYKELAKIDEHGVVMVTCSHDIPVAGVAIATPERYGHVACALRLAHEALSHAWLAEQGDPTALSPFMDFPAKFILYDNGCKVLAGTYMRLDL